MNKWRLILDQAQLICGLSFALSLANIIFMICYILLDHTMFFIRHWICSINHSFLSTPLRLPLGSRYACFRQLDLLRSSTFMRTAGYCHATDQDYFIFPAKWTREGQMVTQCVCCFCFQQSLWIQKSENLM